MKKIPNLSAKILAAVVSISALGASAATDGGDLQTLREQVRVLEQQVKALARQIELREEADAATAKSASKVTVTDKGYALASADAANSLRIRGIVHFDSRLFFGDAGVTNNAFVLRRARLNAEGQLARNYSFQFVTEFGGSALNIRDANFSVAVNPSLQLKFGKFKTPVGLESIQSDSLTFFNERALPSNLTPDRDLGVQASGDLFGGTLTYQLGVFGGLGDGGSSTNTDFDNSKDLVARVMATPFRNVKDSPWRGLSFGVGANTGREKGTAGRTAGYRTDGQQTFFAYNPAVIVDGENWRFSPQVDYRNGPLGVIGEYVVSTVNVRPGATGAKAELQNKAWEVTAGYVLTGDDSSYNGVVPRTDFNYQSGTWGGLELVARYAALKIDDAAFPVFASPASNADGAKALGFGFNWYLSKAVVFKIDYYQTKFAFNALAPAVSAAPLLRQDEKAFVSRFQIGF